MAGEILFMEGFETMASGQDLGAIFDEVSGDWETRAGRTDGGKSIRNEGRGEVVIKDAVPSGSWAFHVAVRDDNEAEENRTVVLRDGDSDEFIVRRTDDGEGEALEVKAGDDVIYEGPDGQIEEDTWRRIELTYDSDDDELTVLLENEPLVTHDASGVSWDRIVLDSGNIRLINNRRYIDDVVLRAGSTPLGDVSIVRLDLVDNGEYADLPPEPEDDDPWEVVSDHPHDADVGDRYLDVDDAGVFRHTFKVDKASVPEDFQVLGITVDATARIDAGGGSGTYEVATRIGGSDYEHDTRNLTGAYDTVSRRFYAENPTTATAWDRDDLDELEVGVRVDINES